MNLLRVGKTRIINLDHVYDICRDRDDVHFWVSGESDEMLIPDPDGKLWARLLVKAGSLRSIDGKDTWDDR
jgi:hypothetical protein